MAILDEITRWTRIHAVRFRNRIEAAARKNPRQDREPVLKDEELLQQWLDTQHKTRWPQVNISMLGAAGSGKISLTRRLLLDQYSDHFFDPTEDYQYRQPIQILARTVMVQIHILMPHMGCEWYPPARYWNRGEPYFMIVYNVGNRESYEIVKESIHELQQQAWRSGLIVANAIDLPSSDHVVSLEEGFSLARSVDVPFQQTSAKTSEGCNKDDLEAIVRFFLVQDLRKRI